MDVAFAIPDDVEIELDGGTVISQLVHHDVVELDGYCAEVQLDKFETFEWTWQHLGKHGLQHFLDGLATCSIDVGP